MQTEKNNSSTAGAGSLPASPAAAVPHSALPWRQNAKEPTVIEADETENGAPYSFVIAEAVIYGAKPSDEELANAAFIVRACNNFDDLLLLVNNAIELWNDEDGDNLREWREKARAISSRLAEIEG